MHDVTAQRDAQSVATPGSAVCGGVWNHIESILIVYVYFSGASEVP